MIAITSLLLLAVVVFCVWRFGSRRAMRGTRGEFFLLGAAIALVRVVLFLTGALALLRPDSLPTLASELVFAGLPEIFIVKALRFQPGVWIAASCTIVIAGSFAWVALFTLIVSSAGSRQRRRGSQPPAGSNR